MASCPVCHKAIEIKDSHMGALYNCPHCSGVFFIGWDGQPELAASHEAPVETPEPFAPVEGLSGPLIDGMGEMMSTEQPLEATPIEATTYESVPEAAETVYQSLPSLEKPLEDSIIGADPMFGEVETPQENFADVTAFGNSTQAGNLSYTLILKGVELEESLRTLREALTDSRFGWNTDEIMARVIASGELVLKGINPTKAAILVGRIKFLPIEIEWTQEVFDGSV